MRRLNAIALLSLGTLWAGLLVVGGGLMVARSGAFWPGVQPATVCAGLTGVAAGEFVFAVIVADRLFPQASRRVTATVETTAGGLLVVGLAVTIALLLVVTPE